MKKIYIVSSPEDFSFHTRQYANWILPLGFELTHQLDETTSLCMLTGGEDWHYSWTNCYDPHPTCACNVQRDKMEMEIIRKALSLQVPIIGICRGSQILPYLIDNKKGKIAQHQNNPGYIHPIKTYDGLKLDVSSTHHQCAYPYFLNKNQYTLLGWSENLLRFRYLNAKHSTLADPETEVVVYNRTAIGFQMHPEMQFGIKDYDSSISWYQKTLLKFLNGEFLCQKPM